MSSIASVLIVEHRPAIAAHIAGLLASLPRVHLLGCITHAARGDTLTPDTAPDVVICGTGILLPQTLAEFSALRAAWPKARLIALSYDPTLASLEAALSSGADAYVSGLDRDLRAAIQRVLPDAGSTERRALPAPK